jgi:putative ABC transport system permease protein
MRALDLLQETYEAITVNKVRTGLTMLGIVIGIGSVIALVSLGQGAQKSIEDRIQSIGSNLLMVRPGAQRGFGGVSSGRGSAQSLVMADAEAIAAEVSGVRYVAPQVSSRQQVTAKGTNTNTSITGTVPDYSAVRAIDVENGSFITDQNVKSRSKVAVLGPTVRDDLFGEGSTDVVGRTIRIKKMDFKVIGVTVSKGGTGFGSSDDVIFVPVTTAQQFLTGNEYLSEIDVEAIDQNAMTQLQEDITALLLTRHGMADASLADFNIMNQADIVATATSVTGTFTMLLAAIAAISLLVGGIGIMNMMLTTVTERTREIGLRKAIGARRRDIVLQFLGESVLLTFIGGGIGILAGWSAAQAVTKFAGMQTEITLQSIVMAFGVSAAIGIIFGYYPARRASGLRPIEALRYE